MDFSQTEPKPEVIKNLPKTFPPEKHVVDRNKQDLMNFFNVSPKTRVALSVSAAGILLFFFSIFTGVFQNQQLDTLYPKDSSQASQENKIHIPIEGPGFGLIGMKNAQLNNPYELRLDVNSGTESATIMTAQVKFDPKLFEVQSVLIDESIVKDWIDNNVTNTDGVISLVGSFPKGYTAKKGDNFAKIIMIPKKPGQTTIYVDTKNSHIYRMGDKAEIPIQHDQLPIEIK